MITFLWILGSSALFFTVFLALFLAIPVHMAIHYAFSDDRHHYAFGVTLIHPLIFRMRHDPGTEQTIINLFGKPLGGRPKQDPSTPDEDTSAQSTEEQYRREEPAAPAAEIHPASPAEQPPLRHDPVSREIPETRDTEPFFADDTPEPRGPEIKIDTDDEDVMDKESEKKPGILVRIRKNRVYFFVTQTSWQKKIIRWATRTIRRLWRLIAFDFFSLHVKAHFENPALTGTIAGYVSSLHMLLATGSTPRRVEIGFDPVFNRECFDIRGGFGVRTSGWRLIYPVIAAVLTFPAISTLIVWYRSRKYLRVLKERDESTGEPSS